MDHAVAAAPRGARLWVLAGVGGALLIALLVALPSARRWIRAERSVSSATLRIGVVTRGDLLRDLSVQGRVVASLHPTLFSGADGIISLKTKAGTRVRTGEVLAIIESKELQSSWEQARAQLLSLRAELERQKLVARQAQLRAAQEVELLTLRLEATRRNLVRTERTFKEGLSNRADYESAQDGVRIAEMELERATRESALAREMSAFEIQTREQQVVSQLSVADDLGKRVEALTIRAPFDGMVASVAVQNSDAVARNQPVMAVVNLTSLEVEIAMPEEYSGETTVGTRAAIQFEGREYPGVVTAISPEVVANQVAATVAFEGGQPAGLKQSQRLTTRLVFESKKNVLKLPRGAFVDVGGGRTAWVVDGTLATRRDIALGAMSTGEVEVLRGLGEGERVIVSDTTALGDAKEVLLR